MNLIKALVSLCAVCAITQTTSAQSYSLTPLWEIAPLTPGYEWVATNHVQRGLAYNPATGHLLTVSRYPATNASVYVLDGNNGAPLGNLSSNGIFAEINFPLNMIGVADDGTIYACNLTVDSTNIAINNNGPFRIYRWASESADPVVAYMGDPSDGDTNSVNRRFGDSLAVRGSGVDTEIITASRSGRIMVRFTTVDGTNFTHQKIDAPELTGAPFLVTISFGAGNTCWVKPEYATTNVPLQHFSFDPGMATATLLRNYTNMANAGGPLCFDPGRNLLAIIRSATNEFRLFKLTEFGFVQQDSTRQFPASYPNGNCTGSVAFGGEKLFALESNNGIVAYRITTNGLPPFRASCTIISNQVSVTWPSINGFNYQVQYKDSLDDLQWSDLGSPTNGNNGVIDSTDSQAGAGRFYRVRAQ